MVTGPALQAAEPPATAGAEGDVRSIVQRTLFVVERMRPPTRPLTLTRNVCAPGTRFPYATFDLHVFQGNASRRHVALVAWPIRFHANLAVAWLDGSPASS